MPGVMQADILHSRVLGSVMPCPGNGVRPEGRTISGSSSSCRLYFRTKHIMAEDYYLGEKHC